MADPSAGSTHRFERDLREIREARGVSIAQVQQETRIPADVLERFENERLTGDPHFNEVYLKALLRAYADAVGVSPNEAVRAYEAQKSNSYTGELRQHLGGTPPPQPEPEPAEPEPVPEKKPDKAPSRRRKAPVEEDQRESAPAAAPAAAAPPAVAALSRARKAEPAPPPPRADQKARVQNRQSVTSSTSSIDSSWGLIIGGTVIGVLLIAGVLWLLLRDDSPQPVAQQETEAVAEDTVAATEVDAPQQPAATPGPQLQMPIQVTLIAEDDALTNFRVTEEPDVRRPYWLEQGERQTFSSDSMVVLWGTEAGGGFGIPSAARVEMQGFTWNPPDGSVVTIDRQRGQALLDSLHRAQTAGGP